MEGSIHGSYQRGTCFGKQERKERRRQRAAERRKINMKVLDTYNTAVGAVIAVLTYIFGEHWALFALFLAFNAADWITGWMKSRIAHKESSSVGWKGVLKKLGYWLMIAVAFGAVSCFCRDRSDAGH